MFSSRNFIFCLLSEIAISNDLSIPNLSKFSKDGILKFTDGYSMYNYWINNYQDLIKISPKIRIEYQKFLKQKKNEEKKKKKALESLEEINKLRKVFSYYFTNLTLERLEKFSKLDLSIE